MQPVNREAHLDVFLLLHLLLRLRSLQLAMARFLVNPLRLALALRSANARAAVVGAIPIRGGRRIRTSIRGAVRSIRVVLRSDRLRRVLNVLEHGAGVAGGIVRVDLPRVGVDAFLRRWFLLLVFTRLLSSVVVLSTWLLISSPNSKAQIEPIVDRTKSNSITSP